MTPIEERIKAQEDKLKQLKALRQRQESALRAAQAKKDRSAQTRRKVLAGALVLGMMEESEETKKRFLGRLDMFLTRADDRALFDLPPKPEATAEASSTPMAMAA